MDTGQNSIVPAEQGLNADQLQNWASKAADWAKQRNLMEQQQFQYQYYQQYGTQSFIPAMSFSGNSPNFFPQSNAVLPVQSHAQAYNSSLYTPTLQSGQYQQLPGGLYPSAGQQYPVASVSLNSQLPPNPSLPGGSFAGPSSLMGGPSLCLSSHSLTSGNSLSKPHIVSNEQKSPQKGFKSDITNDSQTTTKLKITEGTQSANNEVHPAIVAPIPKEPYLLSSDVPCLSGVPPYSALTCVSGTQAGLGMHFNSGGPYPPTVGLEMGSSAGESYPLTTDGHGILPSAAGHYLPSQIGSYPPQVSDYPPLTEGRAPQTDGYPPRPSGHAGGFLSLTGGYRPQADNYPPQSSVHASQIGGHPLPTIRLNQRPHTHGGRSPYSVGSSGHRPFNPHHPGFHHHRFQTPHQHGSQTCHSPHNVSSHHQPHFHKPKQMPPQQLISNLTETSTAVTSQKTNITAPNSQVPPSSQPPLKNAVSSSENFDKVTHTTKEVTPGGYNESTCGSEETISASGLMKDTQKENKSIDIVKDQLQSTEEIEPEKPIIPGLDLVEKSTSVLVSKVSTQSSTAMLNSLGKIVTQLQALKSMKTTINVASSKEEEKSEAQKKMAALIENESDSDDDKQTLEIPSTEDPIQARDFEGFEYGKSKLHVHYPYQKQTAPPETVRRRITYRDKSPLHTDRFSCDRLSYQENHYDRLTLPNDSFQQHKQSYSSLPSGSIERKLSHYPFRQYHDAKDYEPSYFQDRFKKSKSPLPEEYYQHRRFDSRDSYQHKECDSPLPRDSYQHRKLGSLIPKDSCQHRRPGSPSSRDYHQHRKLDFHFSMENYQHERVTSPRDYYSMPQSPLNRDYYKGPESCTPKDSYKQTYYEPSDSYYHQQDRDISSRMSSFQENLVATQSFYEQEQYPASKEYPQLNASTMKAESQQIEELPNYAPPQRFSFFDNMKSVDYEHGKAVSSTTSEKDWFYQQANLSPLIDHTLKELQQKGLPKWLKEELERMDKPKTSSTEVNMSSIISNKPIWKEDLQEETKDFEHSSERKCSVSTNNEEDLSLKHPQNEDGSKIDEDTLLILFVRQVMTEVLLDVTTSEIQLLAKEILGYKSKTLPPGDIGECHFLGLAVHSSYNDSDCQTLTGATAEQSKKRPYEQLSKRKSSHHLSRKKARKKSPAKDKRDSSSTRLSEKNSSSTKHFSSSNPINASKSDRTVSPTIKSSPISNEDSKSSNRLSFSVVPSKRQSLSFVSSNWDAPPHDSVNKSSTSSTENPLFKPNTHSKSTEDNISSEFIPTEGSSHKSTKKRCSSFDYSEREFPSPKRIPNSPESLRTKSSFKTDPPLCILSTKETFSYASSDVKNTSKGFNCYSEEDSSYKMDKLYHKSVDPRESSKKNTSSHKYSKSDISLHESSKISTSLSREYLKRDVSSHKYSKRDASLRKPSKRDIESSKRDTSSSMFSKRDTSFHESSKGYSSSRESSKRDISSCEFSKRDTLLCKPSNKGTLSREIYKRDIHGSSKGDISSSRKSASSRDNQYERKISPSHSYLKKSSPIPVPVKRHLRHYTSNQDDKKL